jgi:repressor LexA
MPEETKQIIRPTKKQQELLKFIDSFIQEHGYSPSYREIMAGCQYNSVATVALHVGNLIKRGHLEKRDNSARSLEVVSKEYTKPLAINAVKASEEKWLIDLIETKFRDIEGYAKPPKKDLDGLYVLVGALRVLGIDGAAQSFLPKLGLLKDKLKNEYES